MDCYETTPGLTFFGVRFKLRVRDRVRVMVRARVRVMVRARVRVRVRVWVATRRQPGSPASG